MRTALAAPWVAMLFAAGCSPECVDDFDCRGKNTASQTYQCQQNACMVKAPVFDAGGLFLDAGRPDAGGAPAPDAGQPDGGQDAGPGDAGPDAGG